MGNILSEIEKVSAETGVNENVIMRIMLKLKKAGSIGIKDGDVSDIKAKLKTTDNEDEQLIDYTLPARLRTEEFTKAWKRWKEYRKEIKKKLTTATMKSQLIFLENQPEPIRVIENSIRNGWQGLFEIKNTNFNGNKDRRNKLQEFVEKETF